MSPDPTIDVAAVPPDERAKVADAIRAGVEARGPDKTICPSEVARDLYGSTDRAHMNLVREVAHELQRAGELRVTQRGAPVDAVGAHGPIRLGLPRS